MKEFFTSIFNFLFPWVPNNVAMWLTIAFFVVLVAIIVSLCVWLHKTKKAEVEDISINNNENTQPLEQNNNEEVLEETKSETTEQSGKDQTEKVENQEEVAEEKTTEEEKVEVPEKPKTKTKKQPKEEIKEEKTEKSTTKKTKSTKKTESNKEQKVEEVKAEEPVSETETANKNTETNEDVKPEEQKVRAQKYMVIYDKEKKDWVIKKTGALKASKRCKTKKEALEFVEKYAENQDLNISIKKKDGKFQKKY